MYRESTLLEQCFHVRIVAAEPAIGLGAVGGVSLRQDHIPEPLGDGQLADLVLYSCP